MQACSKCLWPVCMQALDGKWGCSDITQQYPAYGQQLLHPCASLAGACCDGLAHASLLLRLTTFFHVPVCRRADPDLTSIASAMVIHTGMQSSILQP